MNNLTTSSWLDQLLDFKTFKKYNFIYTLDLLSRLNFEILVFEEHVLWLNTKFTMGKGGIQTYLSTNPKILHSLQTILTHWQLSLHW